MLDTAPVAVDPIAEPPVDPNDPQATRPVRMLVRTERRGHLFLPERDTLAASDVGVNRHTTDADISEMTAELLGDSEWFPTWTDQQTRAEKIYAELRRLRDGLAQPRDIDEAREWGLYVPHTRNENWQEFLPDAKAAQRLGWWFVYDLERRETRAQRAARYLADRRLIDTKGLSRIQCRSYPTMKSLKAHTDNARVTLDTPAILDGLVDTFIQANPAMGAAEAREILVAESRQLVYKGTPRPVDKAGQSDLFLVCDGFSNGADTTRLDEWFHYRTLPQTGRPRGSRNRPKAATS